MNSCIETLLSSRGPFCEDVFEPGSAGASYFSSLKVLVIGAGGLGCELLKTLALSGFSQIDIIDMDTVDVSNLNRQFLFRSVDVGKPKAKCASDFVKRRIPHANIIPHYSRIEAMDDDFYKQFNIVIGGLDSVSARTWISDKLCQIARETNGDVTIPYIDGGTEAWKGHVMFQIPMETACMRCMNELFPKPVVYQACTVVSNPRQPEHCIVWAKEHQWEKERNGEVVDGDCEEHINWICQKAKEHARKFKINEELITVSLTKGVVKNIIPAIASTQAIIAAMCTTEAIKIATATAPNIHTNFMYVGDAASGLFGNHFFFEKNKNCLSCSIQYNKIELSPDTTVKEVLDKLKNDYDYPATSLRTASKTIYMPIIQATHNNLNKPISTFVNGESIVAVSKERQNVFEFEIEYI